MKLKQTLVASTTVLALAVSLAACSDDSDNDTSSESSSEVTDNTSAGDDTAADEAAEDDAAAEDEAPEASTGGETSVKVEGKDLSDLDLDTVTCTKQGGKITVASGSVGGQEGLGVMLTDAEQPKVEALSMVVDGVALAVTSSGGANVGSAEVEVDGDNYTITGEATGADTEDPTAGMITKEFEIKVSCG